jgi:lysophospholipase L1-like esterase
MWSTVDSLGNTKKLMGRYTTRMCVTLFPKVLSAFDADSVVLITIFLGANDATIPAFPQHVPLQEYKENLEKVLFDLTDYLAYLDRKRNSSNRKGRTYNPSATRPR